MRQELTNIALIGCGNHMSEILHPMLRLIPGINIGAVVSQSGISARAFADKWSVPKVLPNWQECFFGGFHAIICSGPVRLHEEVARACVKENMPLFVEKPIVRNSHILNELIQLTKSTMAPLQVGYNLRYSDSINAYKVALVDESAVDVHIEYHTNKPNKPLWGLETLTQSFLLAIAVHPLSVAQHLSGEVLGVVDIKLNTDGTHIQLEIKIQHASQKISNVTISNTAKKFEFKMSANTRDGGHLQMPNLLSVLKYRNTDNLPKTIYQHSALKPINHSTGYLQQFNSFISAVRDSSVDRVNDLENSKWMYELFDKILKEASK